MTNKSPEPTLPATEIKERVDSFIAAARARERDNHPGRKLPAAGANGRWDAFKTAMKESPSPDALDILAAAMANYRYKGW